MTQKNQFAIAVLAAFVAFAFAGGIQASETVAHALHVDSRMSTAVSHLDKAIDRRVDHILSHR